MIDFYSNVIVSFLYCGGFLGSIYYLYSYKLDKQFIVDYLLIFLVHLLLNDSSFFIFYKEMVFMVFGFVIIFFNHRESFASALMFAFVIFFKLIFSYPLHSILYASNEFVIGRMFVEHTSFIVVLMIGIANIFVAIIYFLGAYILKKTVDIRRSRISKMYYHFSGFIMIMILIVSYLQDFVINTMIINLPIEKQYAVIFYGLIGMAFFPFLGIFLLKRVYIQDIENEALEKELLKINNTRMLAYRYTHNINSIMLTISILAKKRDEVAIEEYLDNLRV